MWISKAAQGYIDTARAAATVARENYMVTAAELTACRAACERYAADAEWFKMRINQLERERAALMRSVQGVRIDVPEFLPAYDPKDAVQPDQDMFKGVGEDDPDDNPAVSLDMMPKRTRN